MKSRNEKSCRWSCLFSCLRKGFCYLSNNGLWIVDHVYLLLSDFIMASASFYIFQNHFGACRLLCHTTILSLSLSIQPLVSSSYCLPLMYSCPHWLQGIFQSSKHPASFSPCSLLQQWHWEGLTLAAVPASPYLLKAEGPAHLLDASPAVLPMPRKLHTREKCWVKHSISREPKRFDFLQSPAQPLRMLKLKLCLLLPNLLPWSPWHRGQCLAGWWGGTGLALKHMVRVWSCSLR